MTRASSSTGAVRHLLDVVAYAATRRQHEVDDRETAAALLATAHALDLPPGLELTWLGVAGVGLAYEGVRILVDPYVSRMSFADVLRRRPVASQPALVDRFLPRADAVLLGHTHFDHALDAAAVARRDGCPVLGGLSAARLMSLHGLQHQSVQVAARQVIEVGPFEITFVPSRHAPLALGRSVPNGGEITCEHVEALTPRAYCCGEVWGIHIAVAGRTFYHQGSADVLEDQVRHRDVDYFLCGVAGRQVSDDYLERVLDRLAPRHLLALHHDNLFQPLDAHRLEFAFGVDLCRLPDEVARVTTEVHVSVPPLLESLRSDIERVPLGDERDAPGPLSVSEVVSGRPESAYT